MVWTLAQAIQLNPGGINDPKQVATLTGVGGKAVARSLTIEEIAEHEANVDGAIEYLRGYRNKLQGEGAVELPKPAG